MGGTQGLTDDEAKAKGADFLFDDIRQRVAAGGVAFDFNLQLAQGGDKIDSAVTPLPEDRKRSRSAVLASGRFMQTSLARA